MSDPARRARPASARADPAPSEPRTVAVIEIGSTGIRMVVAQIDGAGGFKNLDKAGRPSIIGRDVFTTGLVSREAIRETVAVLSSYRELLRGYGLAPEDATVIATSALREASNRDTFVDRVSLQTGFAVSIVEDIEENHLMYLGVQRALADERRLLSRSNALILEVGGGSTELMLLRRGRMAGAHSLRIGTLRLDEQVRGAGASQSYLMKFIEDNVRTACDNLDTELPLESVKTFIVIGSDARLAASHIASESNDDYSIASRDDFVRFAEETAALSPEECVAKLRVPWSDAEGFAPGLAVERLFLERTGAETVVVPNVSIREGVLISISRGPDTEMQEEMHRQVVASAISLGRRYRHDEPHALHVAALCLELFDALEREHGLGRRERLILEAAAILHDVGTFIRSSGHHKHGEYIVANSEIFGLSRDDLVIASNIVRYHRKAPPSNQHLNFIALAREDRVAVMKLAAILRVADALDRGHDQRVRIESIERREDRLALRAAAGPGGALDLSLERLSLADKGDMFENVFGLEPVLT